MVPDAAEPRPVLEQFLHSRERVGRIERPDAEASVVNPACGDELQLSVRIRAGRIVEARFQASGCAAAIAAGAAAAEMLEGQALEEVAAHVTSNTLDAALGGLPRHRRHAAVLAAEAILQLESEAARGRSD
jgi:NifU-like protein involved in Fe-S cluster formation